MQACSAMKENVKYRDGEIAEDAQLRYFFFFKKLFYDLMLYIKLLQ